ncbi:unnamed protein product [Owenia fusiformis]|uniref:Serine/threonine-protein phosphatase 4 regulatory subunit 4 n=1 Tax=Owenia fusiformis TaxID=6347 RepID=A0A8S4PHI7_OWEFU|nr:unnamed protein product [Owenia fusiformis]
MDSDDASLSEEFQELQLERTITKSLKTAEEIERLTVDVLLSDIERAVYLLSSGQEVQRVSVITNLPDLLRDNNADCMRRVVPKVKEVLHVAQTEMQLAACAAFLQILRKELVPVSNYTQTFLQTILNSLDSRDPEIASAWLDTLLDVIDLLPKDVIKKDILGIAIAKGQLAQSVQSRLACCKILGKVATKFEPFVIKKEILPVVQSLCQDVDYEVRGCMCRQLDPVARGLGLEATKSAILPELVELTNDEEGHVRLAGLETVVNILSLLDDDTCSMTIVPLVCKFCQQAVQAEDNTLPVIAKQLGKLCHGLSVNLTDDQKKWFVEYYKKLCRMGLEKHRQPKESEQPSKGSMDMDTLFEELDLFTEVRKHAAYNFPAMILFAGARHFKTDFTSIFSQLCNDPHYLVRKTMAYGFHEVTKVLGGSVHSIQADFTVLLKDTHTEVLRGIVSHLDEILNAFVKNGGSTITESKMAAMSEVIPALLHCEGVIFSTNNWRLQEEMMSQWACLPHCLTSDHIYNKFIPVVFNKLHRARAIPVRHASAHTLLVLLRHLRRQEQRTEILQKLIQDFCHGNSSRQRSLFIRICHSSIDLFSKSFFKEHLFEYLLELSHDPIPNVRLKLCSILPRLKTLVKIPTDRGLLQQLEICVRKLLVNEKDIDVHTSLRKAVEKLDRVQVQMESLTKKMYFEEDVIDNKKEEFEKKLIEQEEKEKKEEEAKLGKDKKKGDKRETKAPVKKGSKIPAATSLKDKSSAASLKNAEKEKKIAGQTNVTKATPVASKNLKNVSTKSSNNLASPKLGSRNSPSNLSSGSSSRNSSAGSTGSWKGSAGSAPPQAIAPPTSRKNSIPKETTASGLPTRKKSGSGVSTTGVKKKPLSDKSK